uniref:Asialoglycoprotein receptor-like 1 n=1 Tax=Oryzias melastigma TaxID=30732 RepID=A0A3B3DPR5_ORYME
MGIRNKLWLFSLKSVWCFDSGSCREGWASFQGSCYWLSSTTATWKKAEETCRSHGAHLLVVNSAEELVMIFHYWIGLVEPHQEGEWTWVDGTDFSSTPTENGEDCGQLHASVKRIRKLWNDADCNLSYRFICETEQESDWEHLH